MKEIWQVSYAAPHLDSPYTQAQVTPPVTAWWLLFLGQSLPGWRSAVCQRILVEYIKQREGKCLSGGDLIASFLDEHAVDEFVISVVPVFIGDGIPLIARRHRHLPLDLQSLERFEDGVVQLRYRVQNHA